MKTYLVHTEVHEYLSFPLDFLKYKDGAFITINSDVPMDAFHACCEYCKEYCSEWYVIPNSIKLDEKEKEIHFKFFDYDESREEEDGVLFLTEIRNVQE